MSWGHTQNTEECKDLLGSLLNVVTVFSGSVTDALAMFVYFFASDKVLFFFFFFFQPKSTNIFSSPEPLGSYVSL